MYNWLSTLNETHEIIVESWLSEPQGRHTIGSDKQEFLIERGTSKIESSSAMVYIFQRQMMILKFLESASQFIAVQFKI